MPIPIRTARVREVLLPHLGTDMLDQAAVAERVAEVLRRYAPYRQPLEELSRQLTDLLFSDLYARLGPRMTLRLDDGRQARIRVADLPDLADEALGVLFESLPDNEATLHLLRDYAMHTTSLAAMRALLQRFASQHAPEEQALLRRIIRDNYPPERYSGWLA